jgi:hypothetical protein
MSREYPRGEAGQKVAIEVIRFRISSDSSRNNGDSISSGDWVSTRGRELLVRSKVRQEDHKGLGGVEEGLTFWNKVKKDTVVD